MTLLRCGFCDRVLRAAEHSNYLTVLECPVYDEPASATSTGYHEGLTVFDPKKELSEKYS